jgi:putative hydrolase of HD superfamily
MLAWYIVDSRKLSLDMNLVIQYALIHDLVEAYAGDTYIFAEDKNYVATKEEREQKAQEKLQKDFSEMESLHELIGKYEKREDDESKFVYALDKIHPIINIYLDKGRTWKHENLTFEKLFEYKKNQVKVSPEIEMYFRELMKLIQKDEKNLFS